MDWSSLEDEPGGCRQDTEENVAAQFAPLLSLRRKQVIEATKAASRNGCGAEVLKNSDTQPTTEDALNDAIDAMSALSEAARSADALYEEVLGGEGDEGQAVGASSEADKLGEVEFSIHEELADESSPAQMQVTRSSSSSAVPSLEHDAIPPPPVDTKSAERTQERSRESSPLTVGEVVGSFAGAAVGSGWSVAEAFLSLATGPPDRRHMATEAAGCAMPCIEGVLRVDGDLTVDVASLRETLRAVLRSLLEPLAQVRSIILAIPEDRSSDSSSTLIEGHRRVFSFAYRIFVADPHDVEPLRETLLLEAESGGARRLLPLLAERLCNEGAAMPRHLKVRLDVQSGQ